MSKKTTAIYNALSANGDFKGSEQDFNKKFFAPGKAGYEYRKGVYDTLHKGGADVGSSYEEFGQLIGLRAAPRQQVQQTPQTPQPQATQKPKPTTSTPMTDAEKRAMIGNTADMVAQTGQQIAQTGRAIEHAKRHTGLDVRTPKLGQNRNVDKVQDPVSGKVQYETEDGQVYDNEAYATQAQTDIDDMKLVRQLEQAKARKKELERMASERLAQFEKERSMAFSANNDINPYAAVAGQAEQDEQYRNIMAEIRKNDAIIGDLSSRTSRITGIDAELEEAKMQQSKLEKAASKRRQELASGGSFLEKLAGATKSDPLHGGMRDDQNEKEIKDEEYGQLMAAIRQNRQAIQILEDKKKNQMNSFWHSFATAATNGYNFSDGMGEIKDAIAISNAENRLAQINAKRQRGEVLTREEESAEQVLTATLRNQAMQGKYGDDYGMWARAGAGAPVSIDMMKNIGLGLGLFQDVSSGIAKAAINTGYKQLAKATTKGLAKGMARTAMKGIIKATGVTLGSIAGGATISNTTGIGKTIGDAAKMSRGNVNIDKNGNLLIEDKKGLIPSIIESERANIIENGSEMLGEFLPALRLGKLGMSAAKKLGLSNVSKFFTQIGTKQWYKQYNRALRAAGYNDMPNEFIEEYAGILGNELTGDSEGGLKSLKDFRTHQDIGMGVLTIGALMGAPNVVMAGAGAAQYYRYKHAMERAAKVAGYRLTEEKWKPLQEAIDNTPNEKMTDLLMDIYGRKDLEMPEKKAAYDYIHNLMKYRGYNVGTINFNDSRKAEGDPKQDADMAIEEKADAAYTDGYNAQGVDMARAKREYDTATKRLIELLGGDTVDALSEEPVLALKKLHNDGALEDDATRDAATAFVNAKMKFDGVVQRAKDDLDGLITDARNAVEQRTHQDGAIHPVTLKEDNKRAYVVDGNIAMLDDGTTIDTQNSDDTIIIRGEDGKLEFTSPDAIMSVGDLIDPAEEREMAEQAITQDFGTRRAAEIDGIDENGQPIPLGDEEVQAQAQQGEAVPTEQQAQTEETTATEEQQPHEAQQLPTKGNASAGEMPMLTNKEGEQEPDFMATTPQRAHQYIYDEAELPRDVADEFVKNNAKAAQSHLDKLKKKQPKMGTSIAKYKAEQAAYAQEVQAAEQAVQYWDEVKAVQEAIDKQQREEMLAKQAAAAAKAKKVEEDRLAQEAAKRDEQKRREAGNVHSKVREKWANAKKAVGVEDELTLPNGEKVKGHYVLVENGAATPSHDVANGFAKSDGFPVDQNGNSVNDRDYERDKDAQDVTRSIAENYDGRALQNQVVVSPDGVVLSGNGRTMAGELAAINNTDGAYIEHLVNYPQKYGFTKEQVMGMKHPRVVFMTDESMPYTAETFAKFNQQEMKGQSKTEQSVKLGKVVTDEVFNRIIRSINGYDTLADFYADTKAARDALLELQAAGIITHAQMAEMFDGDGISAQGRELLENMLIGKGFEGNPDAIRQLAEYKGMRQSVIAALAEIANNKALGEDYELGAEFAAAISLAYQARKAGFKVGERVSSYARQMNLFAFDDDETVADYTNATILMLADVLNDKRTSSLKKLLAVYNHRAVDQANGQLDLFGDGIKEKKDIIKEVKELINSGTKQEQREAIDRAVDARKESVQQDGTSERSDKGSEPNRGQKIENNETKEYGRHGAKTSERTLPTEGLGTEEVPQGKKKDTSRKNKDDNPSPSALRRTATENGQEQLADKKEDLFSKAERIAKEDAEQRKSKRNDKEIEKEIAEAEAETDTNPTDAQKESGNYRKGHVRIDGMEISIEQPKGSVRRGTDAKGNKWESKMHNTYGYIRGTQSVDGDHIDVFLSDAPLHGMVYVIDQVNPETGEFDEHKVMYGFESEDAARKAYLSNYEKGWKGLGAITEVSREDFKEWVQSSKRKTKPFSEYKSVKESKETKETKGDNTSGANAVLSQKDYVQKRLSENLANTPYKTLEEWETADIEGYSEQYDNMIAEYPSYLRELAKSEKLQEIYDRSSVKEQKKIREHLEDADIDYKEVLNTSPQRTRVQDRITEPITYARGVFSDGTTVEGKVIAQTPESVIIEQNGRKYTIKAKDILERRDKPYDNQTGEFDGTAASNKVVGEPDGNITTVNNDKTGNVNKKKLPTTIFNPFLSEDNYAEQRLLEMLPNTPYKSLFDWELLDEDSFSELYDKMVLEYNKLLKKWKRLTDKELLDEIAKSDSKQWNIYVKEYDIRHNNEYQEEVNSRKQSLEDENVSLDASYTLYMGLAKRWADGGYSKAERTSLRAQLHALEDYISRKEHNKLPNTNRTAYRQAQETVREVGYNLTDLRLRPLEKGEICHVERRYTESNAFSFTGKEHIESIDDVAYIFKQLETSSVENSFVVLIKDGKPTVIHLAIGSYSATLAPIEQAIVAVEAINPDKVVFVHNHPSGKLIASKQDMEMQLRFKKVFGDKTMPAIIINTTSGKFGTFSEAGNKDERIIPGADEQDNIPITVYQFNKQVFDKDWNPETAFKANSLEDVAAYISSHRLGEHKKISLLVLDNSLHITGNVFLPWTKLTDINSKNNIMQIISYVNQMGGRAAILYGNYELGEDTTETNIVISNIKTALSNNNLLLTDVINIDDSASFRGVMEDEVTYAKRKPIDKAEVELHKVKSEDDTKTLMGVHNITEDKLLKAIKMGGLVNPSAAIIDTSKSVHNDYGEISLIMPSYMVDKRTGRNAGTFEGDAWTPMYPSVEKRMTPEGSIRMEEDINDVPKEMQHSIWAALSDWIKSYANTALHYLFLHQRGNAPDIQFPKPKYSDEILKAVSSLMDGSTNIYTLPKETIKKLTDVYVDFEFNGDKKAFRAKTDELIAKSKNALERNKEGSILYKSAQLAMDDVADYGYPLSPIGRFVKDVQNELSLTTRPDVQGTLAKASEVVEHEGLSKDYEDWLRGLDNRYEAKEEIFDGFTPSGKRRYIPNTLENVSKLMKKQGRQSSVGISTSFSNFAASVMKSNNTLANIKKKKGKLTSNHQDIEDFENKWKGVYLELGEKLQPDAGAFDDYGLARLQEAAVEKDPQAYLKGEYGITLSDEDAQKLRDLIKAIQEERPAMYFETKFERPVMLEEFAAAVIPSNLDKKARVALQDAGLAIYEYEPGNKEDRKRAVDEAKQEDGVLFRQRDNIDGDLTLEDVLVPTSAVRMPRKPRHNIKAYLNGKPVNRNNMLSVAQQLTKGEPFSLDNNTMLREIKSTVDFSDYYDGTIAEFKALPSDGKTVYEQWEELKAKGYEWHKSPLSNSEYLIDKETGNIYRYANHWGSVASCTWELVGAYDDYNYHIAVSNISDFKAKGYGRIAYPNVSYLQALNQSIVNVKDVLNDPTIDIKPKGREFLENILRDREMRRSDLLNDNDSLIDNRNVRKKRAAEPKPREEEGQVERSRETYAENKVREMEMAVTDAAAKMNLGNVVVLTSADGLDGQKKRAKGWFDRRTGKITIVLGNHTSVEDAIKTLMHEAVAHYGLRKLFGKDFDTFLDNVYRNAPLSIRRKIVQMSIRHGWNARVATEEYLASLAEDTNFEQAKESGWFQRVKELFVGMLRRLTERYKLFDISEDELRYILWRSYENLTGNGGIMGAAQDVVKRKELLGGTRTAGEPNILFRQIDQDKIDFDKAIARGKYEHRMRESGFQSVEAMQDSMKSLMELYKAVDEAEKVKREVEDIPDSENAYVGENRLSSVNQAELDDYNRRFFKPLLNSIGALARTDEERQDLFDYMMAKHGLERNNVMATREAQKEYEELNQAAADGKGTAPDWDAILSKHRKRDYSGLTTLMRGDEDEIDTAAAEQRAKELVERYEEEKGKADIDNLWYDVNAANAEVLWKMYRGGLLSKEAYHEIADMYKYYIPLRGFDEKTSGEEYAYLMGKNSAFTAPMKTAKGRTSKADNPIAQMALMADSAIMQANRNRLVKIPFLNYMTKHPSDLVSVSDMWLEYDEVNDTWKPKFPEISPEDTPEEVERKVGEFEEKMEELSTQQPDKYARQGEKGNIPYRVLGSDMREHQVIVKRNGKDYVLTINGNPRAAQAINGLTNPDNKSTGAIDRVFDWIAQGNRWLSSAYTTRNPDFVVSNFIRDTFYSNMMVHVKEGRNYATKFHINHAICNPVMIGRLLHKYNNGELDMNNELQRYFYEFMMNGGETGWTSVKNAEQHKSDIKHKLDKKEAKISTINDINIRNTYLVASKAFDEINEKLDFLNRAIENSARFAAFVTSRQMGRQLGRSIYDAKEISVNFNKKGSGSKMLGATGQTWQGNTAAFVSGIGRGLYTFWNASVQGLTNYMRYTHRNPVKGYSLATALFGLGLLIPYVGYLMSGDDDDGNGYYDMPEYVRRSNILIKAGNGWAKIALPQEYRAIYGMGELAMTAMSGKNQMTRGEAMLSAAEQLSQVLPIDFMEGGGSWTAAVPTALKPIVEASMNKGWTGLPIYKDTPFNKDDPEWAKSYKGVNGELKAVTKWLSDNTGGDDYTGGAIDLNPAQIEYIMKGMLGGYYSFMDKVVKTVKMPFGAQPVETKDIPFANRLYAYGDERTKERAINNAYFEFSKEHDHTKKLLRNYEREAEQGSEKYIEKINLMYNEPEYARYLIFEEYSKDIDRLGKLRKEVQGDPNATLEIDKQISDLRKEVVNKLREVK
jgi:hypothetical protein|nr:MAG TPA: Type I restriction enzyme [Caudoviricetes sp.]